MNEKLKWHQDSRFVYNLFIYILSFNVCCHKIDRRTGTVSVLPVDANCLLPKTIFYRKWAKTKESDERERDEQGGDRKIGCTQWTQWTREKSGEVRCLSIQMCLQCCRAIFDFWVDIQHYALIVVLHLCIIVALTSTCVLFSYSVDVCAIGKLWRHLSYFKYRLAFHINICVSAISQHCICEHIVFIGFCKIMKIENGSNKLEKEKKIRWHITIDSSAIRIRNQCVDGIKWK